MNILLISGSSKSDSINAKILEQLKSRFEKDHQIVLYKNLSMLPLFNPDIENNSYELIQEIKQSISNADQIIICTPEYIHSIPAALKNLFEWLVSTPLLDKKHIFGIIATSSEGSFAKNELCEILKVVTGNQNQDKLIFELNFIGSKLDQNKNKLKENIFNELISFLEL